MIGSEGLLLTEHLLNASGWVMEIQYWKCHLQDTQFPQLLNASIGPAHTHTSVGRAIISCYLPSINPVPKSHSALPLDGEHIKWIHHLSKVLLHAMNLVQQCTRNLSFLVELLLGSKEYCLKNVGSERNSNQISAWET